MKRVLIIEDEDCVADLLKVNISKRGYWAEIARNGEEGVLKSNTMKPEIVLLDIKLPDIDGWEVLGKMKAVEKDIINRVIVLTAATQKYDRERALSEGVTFFIPKPFDLYHLLHTISGIANNPVLNVF